MDTHDLIIEHLRNHSFVCRQNKTVRGNMTMIMVEQWPDGRIMGNSGWRFTDINVHGLGFQLQWTTGKLDGLHTINYNLADPEALDKLITDLKTIY